MCKVQNPTYNETYIILISASWERCSGSCGTSLLLGHVQCAFSLLVFVPALQLYHTKLLRRISARLACILGRSGHSLIVLCFLWETCIYMGAFCFFISSIHPSISSRVYWEGKRVAYFLA
ncbi:hypothetical protein DL95DRAFT_36547 [Leptodontidium sp. 2 PMI_412]|nr:hypothetical protein DL95DRAFT_36547 [Leptodontidium sp. 2 PMI_412]